MFLADWFEEKCRTNFAVTFSARSSQTGLPCLALLMPTRHIQRFCVLRISTNIIRRKGWHASDLNVCHKRVIRISAKSLTRARWQSDDKSLAVTRVFYSKDVVICGGPSFLISAKIPVMSSGIFVLFHVQYEWSGRCSSNSYCANNFDIVQWYHSWNRIFIDVVRFLNVLQWITKSSSRSRYQILHNYKIVFTVEKTLDANILKQWPATQESNVSITRHR